MTDDEIRNRLAATFDHEPTEVHTSKGPTGQVCCGHCFVNWPCPAVRKIGRVMVPVVRALIAEEAGEGEREHKDWCQAHPEQNRPGWTCHCGVDPAR